MSPTNFSHSSTRQYRFVHVVIALAMVASLVVAAAGPAAAQDQVDREALIVDVHDDGSATLTAVMTYDLTSDAERQAFRSMKENESTVEAVRTRFADRMASVAASAGEVEGREMTVTETSVTMETTASGDRGIVRLSATIENLAAVDGEEVVLTEPFASGFYTERPLIVRAPDGYAVADASPAPDEEGDQQVGWSAGTEFSDFAVSFAPDASTGDDVTAFGTPGFGVGVAVVALLASAMLAVRRRG